MEVLGAVSSAVALAEIFAKSVLTTKKLWDEAQDVPEEINRLMNDLTQLKPMLEEAEAVFINQAQHPSTDTALLLVHNYKEVSGKLHLLAADLNQRIVTAKRGKRNLTKLKAMLSKTLIQRYRSELDSISRTLSFFFNVHNLHSQMESQALHLQSISLHMKTDDKVDRLLSLVQSHLLPQILYNAQSSRLEEDSNNSEDNLVEGVVELSNQNGLVQSERRQQRQKPKPIEWRRPRLFGRYTYQRPEYPGKPGSQVFQLRLELPWCLSGRAWDFEAYSSPMGWKMTIRPWTTRPRGDRIFDLIKEGSWPEIAEHLNSGQASILDRTHYGLSLLDIALQNHRLDVARNLVDMGFDIEGSGLLESIEHTWFCRSLFCPCPHPDALDWFQFAAELGLLENLSEKMFNPLTDYNAEFFQVSAYTWRKPEIFSLLLRERTAINGKLSIYELFRTLRWDSTDPYIFLGICRHKSIGPQLFRAIIMGGTWAATLGDFALTYFSVAPGGFISAYKRYMARAFHETDFKYWKELAGWLLTDISIDELVLQTSESSSPFLIGLYHGIEKLDESDRSPQNLRLIERQLTRTMSSWLEDVQASGIDLTEYGRRQLELHQSSHECFRRWGELSMLRLGDDLRSYGPRLISFTFGPRPQDWKLIWDPDVEEFVGDFWELTENPPLHIPGAYPEDD